MMENPDQCMKTEIMQGTINHFFTESQTKAYLLLFGGKKGNFIVPTTGQ